MQTSDIPCQHSAGRYQCLPAFRPISQRHLRVVESLVWLALRQPEPNSEQAGIESSLGHDKFIGRGLFTTYEWSARLVTGFSSFKRIVSWAKQESNRCRSLFPVHSVSVNGCSCGQLRSGRRFTRCATSRSRGSPYCRYYFVLAKQLPTFCVTVLCFLFVPVLRRSVAADVDCNSCGR